jgi:hypothetical protein
MSPMLDIATSPGLAQPTRVRDTRLSHSTAVDARFRSVCKWRVWNAHRNVISAGRGPACIICSASEETEEQGAYLALSDYRTVVLSYLLCTQVVCIHAM